MKIHIKILFLIVAIMGLSFNLNGQSDTLYGANNDEVDDNISVNENPIERVFQPFFKQINTSKDRNLYYSYVIVQVENSFYTVKKDSLFEFTLDGDYLNSYRLIDPELNDYYNRNFINGLTYDGHYIYAVNNDISKTIFVIDPNLKSIVNKIFATDFNSGIPSSNFENNISRITYDASADSNKGGFWIGNWYNNFSQIDMMGNILNNIVLPYGKIGSVNSILCDNISPNGPFLWFSRNQGYSPNGLDIIPVSIKNDTTFGQILNSKHSLVLDEDYFNFENKFSFNYLTKGFIEGKDAFLIYSYGKYIRCYPLSFPTIDVSAEPFVATNTYFQWPLYAIDTVWFQGTINNASPFSQFGTQLNLSIVKDGITEQSFSGTYNLQPFENKKVVFGPFFPTNKGIYILKSNAFLVGDEDNSNNDAISTIVISDSTFSRDNWDLISNPIEFVDFKHVIGSLLTRENRGQGSLFTIDKPMILTSISALLKPSQPNNEIYFRVYSTFENSITDQILVESKKVISKLEDTGRIKKYIFPIKNGKYHLDAGTYYLFLYEDTYNSFNRLVYTRNYYVPYKNKYWGEWNYQYNIEDDENNIRGSLTIRPNFACKNELLAPSIIQSSQVLSCNSQYTDLKFQWYKNNVPVNNATNKNFYPLGEAGKYSVRINKENCYAMSEVFEIVTGIFNNTTQILNIYPNPTNGKAYINTDATMYGDMEIQIMDILGKTINTQIIKNTQPNQTISIDLKSTETGVYIIHAQIGEQMWEGKLVVE